MEPSTHPVMCVASSAGFAGAHAHASGGHPPSRHRIGRVASLIGLVALVLLLQLPVGSALAQLDPAQDFTTRTASAGTDGPARLGSGSGTQGAALSDPEFLPVSEAYPLAVERAGEGALRLVWQMPPGYYLYQHAFEFELRAGGAEMPVEAALPPALTREDEYFGRVQVYYDGVEITLEAATPFDAARLAVTSQGCADAGLCYPPRTQHFRIAADGAVTELAPPAPRGATRNAGSERLDTSFMLMLVFSFLGGMILNLMPCVLPVLSLKVIGYASAPASEVHRHGLLYSAGVVISFLTIAVVLIALRGAGQAVGWGFQLQSPGFVLGLAYLFVVLGLAMSGVIQLGNRFMNLGSELSGRGGASGSFFTGVLAVIVASPCTAPFMGTALGYALVQPPQVGLAVFAALGAGMALPMLLLSYSRAARRLMPRPGAWMERLKQALAFPLYATALALGVWLWRESLLARGSTIACLLIAGALASWRPAGGSASEQTLPAGSVAFSAQALEQLRQDDRAVFVDVTADWCITCLANERAVLTAESVQQAFRDARVTYMVADWTDYDPEIAAFVASHGRSGIPLYVLYDGVAEPRVLPQLLRRRTVMDALEDVSRPRIADTR